MKALNEYTSNGCRLKTTVKKVVLANALASSSLVAVVAKTVDCGAFFAFTRKLLNVLFVCGHVAMLVVNSR